jgi:hypothetical protein
VQPTSRRASRPRAHRRIERNVVVLALVGIAVVTALVIAAWKFGGSNAKQPIPNLTPPPAAVHHAKAKPHRPVHRRPTQGHLVLTAARGDCWLEVHKWSANGKLVFSGTLEQGKPSLSFTSKRLWVIAGAPQNLDATLNGRAVHFPSGIPVVVVVTPKGITRAASA